MVKDVRDDKGNDDGRSSSPWSGDSKLGVSNLLGIVIVIVLVATIAIGASQFNQLASPPDETPPDLPTPDTEEGNQPEPPDDTESNVPTPDTEDGNEQAQQEPSPAPEPQLTQPPTSDNNAGQASVVSNRPPIALDNLSITTTVSQPVAIQLSAGDKDNDDLTAAIVSNPLHGTLSQINQDTGVVTYAPNLGFVGTDSFTFKVNDGTVDSSNVGTIRILVS